MYAYKHLHRSISMPTWFGLRLLHLGGNERELTWSRYERAPEREDMFMAALEVLDGRTACLPRQRPLPFCAADAGRPGCPRLRASVEWAAEKTVPETRAAPTGEKPACIPDELRPSYASTGRAALRRSTRRRPRKTGYESACLHLARQTTQKTLTASRQSIAMRNSLSSAFISMSSTPPTLAYREFVAKLSESALDPQQMAAMRKR